MAFSMSVAVFRYEFRDRGAGDDQVSETHLECFVI
jgi:hypothetical protein